MVGISSIRNIGNLRRRAPAQSAQPKVAPAAPPKPGNNESRIPNQQQNTQPQQTEQTFEATFNRYKDRFGNMLKFPYAAAALLAMVGIISKINTSMTSLLEERRILENYKQINNDPTNPNHRDLNAEIVRLMQMSSNQLNQFLKWSVFAAIPILAGMVWGWPGAALLAIGSYLGGTFLSPPQEKIVLSLESAGVGPPIDNSTPPPPQTPPEQPPEQPPIQEEPPQTALPPPPPLEEDNGNGNGGGNGNGNDKDGRTIVNVVLKDIAVASG